MPGLWAPCLRPAQKVQAKGKSGKADWKLNQISKLYGVEKLAKALRYSGRCVVGLSGLRVLSAGVHYGRRMALVTEW